jgi:uncharacterized membrane protein YhfC
MAVAFLYLPFSRTPAGVSYAAIVVAELITFMLVDLCFLILVWLAAWRRKRWALWIIIAIFIGSVIADFQLPGSLYEDRPLIAVTVISTVLEVAALYFAFTGDARPWFERREDFG